MFKPLCLSVLVVGAMAIISDLSCTKDGQYTKKAVGCVDRHSNAVCEKFFPQSQVALNGTDERPDSCFNLGGEINFDVRDLALNACPKTCGYCCLTKDYNCNNARNARINCDMVTDKMCSDANWRQILVEDCPATCGFCTLGGCEDKVPGCSEDHCNNSELQNFVQENCKRTCGFCKNTSF